MIVVATRTHNPASEYYNHYKHDTPGGITIRIETTEFNCDQLEVTIRPLESDAERKRRLKLEVLVKALGYGFTLPFTRALLDALEAIDRGDP
jgi:hypothetical protein